VPQHGVDAAQHGIAYEILREPRSFALVLLPPEQPLQRVASASATRTAAMCRRTWCPQKAAWFLGSRRLVRWRSLVSSPLLRWGRDGVLLGGLGLVGRLGVGIDGGEGELGGGGVSAALEQASKESAISLLFVLFALADIWNLRVHTVVVHAAAAAYFLRLLRSCVLFPHLESLGGHQHLNGARSVHGWNRVYQKRRQG